MKNNMYRRNNVPSKNNIYSIYKIYQSINQSINQYIWWWSTDRNEHCTVEVLKPQMSVCLFVEHISCESFILEIVFIFMKNIDYKIGWSWMHSRLYCRQTGRMSTKLSNFTLHHRKTAHSKQAGFGMSNHSENNLHSIISALVWEEWH